jgi:hypothetical protein
MNPRRIAFSLLAAVILTTAAFSQLGGQGANPGQAGQYGLTAWAIDNQRVASQYNYYIPSTLNSGLGGTFTFPISACQNSLYKGVYGFTPFNTNATVQVNDDVSANTETIALTSVTYSGSTCTLALSTANTHYSFRLRSGTCGLREALNDLNGKAGTVIVDQKFYDDGCTASTITTAATVGGTLQANQLINDISGNGPAWYNLEPSTLTALAVPTTSANLTCATTAGLVCQSATTGGTWPNSAEYAGDIYVDALGGWSVASTTATLTPSASATNVLQFNSPAASTGAYGWLPFGGLTYNSATYVIPVTSSICTLSTTFTAYPVCAIGSNATVTTPVTTTSLIPQSGGIAAAYNPNPQSHTTFAYRPSQRPGYGFQLNYGPFVACPALTAGQKCEVGTVQLPTGFLTTVGIGGTVRFTFDVSNTLTTAGTVTGVDVEIGDITDFSTGAPKVVCTLLNPTSTGTANVKYHEECDWTVNALTTSGSIMPGGFGVASIAGSGGAVVSAIAEQGTAAITADVLDQDAVHFVYLQTSGASTTTPPQMLDLKIEVLNN